MINLLLRGAAGREISRMQNPMHICILLAITNSPIMMMINQINIQKPRKPEYKNTILATLGLLVYSASFGTSVKFPF